MTESCLSQAAPVEEPRPRSSGSVSPEPRDWAESGERRTEGGAGEATAKLKKTKKEKLKRLGRKARRQRTVPRRAAMPSQHAIPCQHAMPCHDATRRAMPTCRASMHVITDGASPCQHAHTGQGKSKSPDRQWGGGEEEAAAMPPDPLWSRPQVQHTSHLLDCVPAGPASWPAPVAGPLAPDAAPTPRRPPRHLPWWHPQPAPAPRWEPPPPVARPVEQEADSHQVRSRRTGSNRVRKVFTMDWDWTMGPWDHGARPGGDDVRIPTMGRACSHHAAPPPPPPPPGGRAKAASFGVPSV
jgi:hypothetical protein